MPLMQLRSVLLPLPDSPRNAVTFLVSVQSSLSVKLPRRLRKLSQIIFLFYGHPALRSGECAFGKP